MPIAMDTEPSPESSTEEHIVDVSVQQRLESCVYRFVFNEVTWHYQAGRLTLGGSLPSFYLKQVLQEVLRNIDQVEHIDNNVDVV